MDLTPELFVELRNWIKELGIKKYEVFTLIFVILFFWRLPYMLEFSTEMKKINLDTKAKCMSLEEKINREQKRRQNLKK